MKKHLSHENMLIGLVAVVVVIALFNIAALHLAGAALSEKMKVHEEEARPAKLQLAAITDASCSDCFDIATITELLRKEDVEVTEEKALDLSSAEAQALIEQHGIKKIPALVLSGELNKTAVQEFVNRYGEYRNGAAFVYAEVPYYDVARDAVVGRVRITHLTDASCANCTTLAPLVDAFKAAKVRIVEERKLEYSSFEGGQLVRRFGVDHIPAVIVSSDIVEYDAFKALPSQLNATEKDGFYALHATRPPYRLLSESRVTGLVSVTTIKDSACAACANMTIALALRQGGVFIQSERTVDYSSDEGATLVERYGIVTVPSVVVSKDVDDYADLQQYWQRVNKTLVDGSYLLPPETAPYRDIPSGTVRGLVAVVYLADATCGTCYPVTNHRTPLGFLGVHVENETTIDVSSAAGKELIAKYKITKVPTLLLSPEADAYENLKIAWKGPGVIASDGWFVFIAPELMGTYKDLAAGQVISRR